MSHEIRTGDALALMPGLRADSFDAVITDPPYSSGGAMRADKSIPTATKYVQTGTNRVLPDFEGDSRTQLGYQWWSTMWMAEALRVVREGGWLMVFTDWRQLGTTQIAIEAAGWTMRGLVPWIKPGGRPSADRFRNNAEYVWTATRNRHESVATDRSRYPDGWFRCSAPSDRAHITQKPVELMRHLMQVLPPGSRILDPFAGTGTTGEAAHLEGHGFTGFDVSDKWRDYAERRVTQGVFRWAPSSDWGDVG